MREKKMTGAGIRRRMLSILLILAVALTMGVLPAIPAYGKVPGYQGAKVPAVYSSGDYKIYQCIDISAYQGTLSVAKFQQIKEQGVTHVILRSGFTWMKKNPIAMDPDSVFQTNIKNAHAAGLKIGVYHYSQAKTPAEAQKEANFTLQQIAPYQAMISLPVVFDWEFGSRLNASYAKGKGKSYCTGICNAFCQIIQDAGYEPAVYANLTTMNGYLNADLYKTWKIWLAQYSTTCGYKNPMYMWQYSSSGKISGIKGSVDVNYIFAPVTRVKQSNGTEKFQCEGAYLTSQWLTLQGKKYRLDKKGNSLTGYQKVGEYHYGFDAAGVMYQNVTAKMGGKKYKFAKNGRSILYTAKTKKKLAYRKGAGSLKKKMGTYKKGKVISVVREKGKWVQATNGYWSLKKSIKKKTTYPR